MQYFRKIVDEESTAVQLVAALIRYYEYRSQNSKFQYVELAGGAFEVSLVDDSTDKTKRIPNELYSQLNAFTCGFSHGLTVGQDGAS